MNNVSLKSFISSIDDMFNVRSCSSLRVSRENGVSFFYLLEVCPDFHSHYYLIPSYILDDFPNVFLDYEISFSLFVSLKPLSVLL